MAKKIEYVNISLKEMLDILTRTAMYGLVKQDFYWLDGDNDFHKIVECDLFSGRIVMDDGDFSEFIWETQRSNIYVRYER